MEAQVGSDGEGGSCYYSPYLVDCDLLDSEDRNSPIYKKGPKPVVGRPDSKQER